MTARLWESDGSGKGKGYGSDGKGRDVGLWGGEGEEGGGDVGGGRVA